MAGSALDYLDEVAANARQRGATPEMLAALDSVPESDAAMARRAAVIAPLYFHALDPRLAGRAFGKTVFSSSAAARLRAGIPQADLVVFERSGHLPFLEEPAAFFDAVREWLARVT